MYVCNVNTYQQSKLPNFFKLIEKKSKMLIFKFFNLIKLTKKKINFKLIIGSFRQTDLDIFNIKCPPAKQVLFPTQIKIPWQQ